ncbi:MAG TPA: hypothetical protein VHE80_09870, partial [Acidimicrobiales bacterium]|nr:hypothetical protein [Acidimicrobiales bacterium]
MPPEDSWRLPRAVEPQHYELVLTPDLDDATFEGEGSVRVRVHEPTASLVLNAVDLDISFAELERDDGSRLAGSVSLEDDERAAVHLDDSVGPGTATLRMRWSGRLNDQLKGFYRSTYQDTEGRSRTIAATQFEPTDA